MNLRAELTALANQEGSLTWIALALLAGVATLVIYRVLALVVSWDRSQRLGSAGRVLARRRIVKRRL